MIELSYDLVIRGGVVIDGSGNPWHRADIAVADGRITAVGHITRAEAERIIDADGFVVVPGFIDAHSHSDSNVVVHSQMKSTLSQGITTVVAGQCGFSPAPIDPSMREMLEERANKGMPPGIEYKITWTTFDGYLRCIEESGVGANIAHHVGHNTIRAAAMRYDNRPPSEDELERMRRLTDEAMEAGAFGLSTGLIYPPGMFATADEIVELAKVAAGYGGVYDSHIRGEGITLLKSLAEAIDIGERAGLPVHISHHKAFGRQAWGKSIDTLGMMEEARGRGVDITFDQYPYRAGSTSLVTLLPPWVHVGGMEKLLERLANEEDRKRMRRELESIDQSLPGWDNYIDSAGWENIMVTFVSSEGNKAVEGRNMVEIKEMRDEPDEFTALYKLLLEEEGEAKMVVFSMQEDDIRRIMRHPLGMIGTDSESVAYTGPFAQGKPHPRHFGAYPRILGRHVREERVLRLEQAVRKMTSFPAQRFGLLDRGLIRPGMWADITIFDPETVIDRATYQNPQQRPEGIPYVIVNGTFAIDQGEYTGELAGRVLRKNR